MSSIPPTPSAALSPATSLEESRESRRTSAPAKERDWSQPSTENQQSFSFSDFLSAINPLQHIPIVSSIYRAITGDTINPASRVIGGLLFGGPVGLVTSAFNAMVEQTDGKDLGAQALALFAPDKAAPAPVEPPAQFAEAVPPQSRRPPEEAAAAPVAPTPPPSAVSALGADRTLAASLYGQHQANAATAPTTQGRTLAAYRSFTGRPLPTIDTNRSANTQSVPVRLQPTAPMPERPRAAAAPPPAKESRTGEPAPVDRPAGAEAAATTPPAAGEGFVTAMARGLDRYREQRRIGPAPMQIDATL